MRTCVRTCMCVRVRACVRACVCVCVCVKFRLAHADRYFHKIDLIIKVFVKVKELF